VKMYDSVSPGAMPKDGDVYASYVDHNGVNAFSLLPSLYPGKIYKSISNWGAVGADILDVEHGGNAGSASFSTMVSWVANEYAAGRTPTVYCDESTWPECRQALGNARQPEWWIAGPETIPEGAIGCQSALDQHMDGLNYDVSTVLDSWAKPTASEDNDMQLTDTFNNGILNHVTTVEDALSSGEAAYNQTVILQRQITVLENNLNNLMAHFGVKTS
jgi:hypothetical protein